ncbi:copper resistance CopC family protein [Roseicella frigidaeris]|uniref:copper resistance CopC family protein n=1 Tax=Roseicella frigidaeris TaxID=2230885 RepID=UPI001A9E7B24|nr:copper resistance CopC family protein [Roseicella frigidaeris]
MTSPVFAALSSRRLLLGLLALPLLWPLLRPGAAAAHAVVVTSEPAAGSTLAALPKRIAIHFNSRIDHARSRLLLVGPDGSQRPLPLATETEPTLLEAVPEPVPTPAPGAWRLRWQVLAVDGHITRGDIPFTLQSR